MEVSASTASVKDSTRAFMSFHAKATSAGDRECIAFPPEISVCTEIRIEQVFVEQREFSWLVPINSTQLANMSINPEVVELTADVVTISSLMLNSIQPTQTCSTATAFAETTRVVIPLNAAGPIPGRQVSMTWGVDPSPTRRAHNTQRDKTAN